MIVSIKNKKRLWFTGRFFTYWIQEMGDEVGVWIWIVSDEA